MKTGKIIQRGTPKAPKLELEGEGAAKFELTATTDGHEQFAKLGTREYKKVHYLELDGKILAVSASAFPPAKLQEFQAELARRAAAAAEAAAAQAAAAAREILDEPSGEDSREFTRSKLGPKERPRKKKQELEGPYFNNPYNFIPFSRARGDAGESTALGLGHHAPAGHERWLPKHWHGRIDCELVLDSPLAIVATQWEADGDGDAKKKSDERARHKYVDIPERNGRPWIPGSSLKGCLRSAFEAVTNSRFPRFDTHDDRLGYRQATREGLKLVPCRIEFVRGQPTVRLLPGFSGFTKEGPDANGLYGAWLRRYEKKVPGTSPAAVRDTVAPHSLHRHGELVHAWVRRERHRDPEFTYYRVTKAARDAATLGAAPSPEDQRIEGWAYVTHQNIDNKHDERVFFDARGKEPWRIPLSKDEWARLAKQWAELGRQYRELHRDELRKRRKDRFEPTDYLGNKPGSTAFNPLVFDESWESLGDGFLAYARLDDAGKVVRSLHPVNIGRLLYDQSPNELLPDEFRPARSEAEFSPADRVFGWVRQGRGGRKVGEIDGYRGHLRFGPIVCDQKSADAIEILDVGGKGQGLPLAILGAPKPQQGRFYVGRTDGSAQSDDLGRVAAGYARQKVLRGRKVYPRQRQPDSLWTRPTEDRTQTQDSTTGWYQEYRRAKKAGAEVRDSQNRSLLRWVKKGTTFRVSIFVDNLTEAELGAILHVLASEDPEHRLRVGGGKPFGFGSVICRVTGLDLRDGEAKRSRYLSLFETGHTGERLPDVAALARFRKAFVEETKRLYGEGNPPHLAAYAVAARGVANNHPVHYPRAKPRPDPEGNNFLWFVANDKERREGIHGYALPDLVDGDPLPYLIDGDRGRGSSSGGSPRAPGGPPPRGPRR